MSNMYKKSSTEYLLYKLRQHSLMPFTYVLITRLAALMLIVSVTCLERSTPLDMYLQPLESEAGVLVRTFQLLNTGVKQLALVTVELCTCCHTHTLNNTPNLCHRTTISCPALDLNLQPKAWEASVLARQRARRLKPWVLV